MYINWHNYKVYHYKAIVFKVYQKKKTLVKSLSETYFTCFTEDYNNVAVMWIE